VSELEFLGALHVELLRHRELRPEHPEHELFQTSTVQALLGGAFEGDVTLREVLEHGDLGLGTLDGLDGELIVLDGEAWKAELDGSLSRPDASAKTPYVVVVSFSPGPPVALRGPFDESELEAHLGRRMIAAQRPTAIRIDGRFQSVHVRSVPKQHPPYPPLAEVIAQQRVSELEDVSGTMIGFCFPDALDGIEMVGAHLHFMTDDRRRGGHVLSYTLLEGTALLDDAAELHVELPPAVEAPAHGAALDQAALRRLESDR
jgi:acetolactate decarboxylase